MPLPYFFIPSISSKDITLDEDTSKHVVQVLRMQKGEELLLTDGKGKKATAVIVDDHRKRCVVQVSVMLEEARKTKPVSLAVSLTKNSSRFEWFLEKATEMGVAEIYPLVCERTEKDKFRLDRMQGIVQSAMLQSQQCWMPELHPPTAFNNLFQKTYSQKFIGHCLPGEKKSFAEAYQAKGDDSTLILIGPEGDFTPEEISLALSKDFVPVSFGETRLRTETAGVVAAALAMIGK